MEIEVQNVGFTYPNGKEVFKGINMKIGGSKLYCIIGPNGVGKSTFVKCLNKLLSPTEGTILIDGKDVKECTFKELADKMSFIPVSQGYNFKMTVSEVVLLGRYSPHKWRTSDEDMRKVFKSLQVMEIEDLAMRDITELSAGQCQKVNICKGFVHEPEMLILDEPTANLDVRHQMFVTELLKAMSHENNMTTLMISHDLNIAAKFADEIIIFSEPGKIYAMGPPKQVITEKAISEVYGVKCQVLDINDSPYVVLENALPKASK